MEGQNVYTSTSAKLGNCVRKSHDFHALLVRVINIIYTCIHPYTNLCLFIHKGISSFIKTSLKTVTIAIGIIVTFILLYYLVTGVTSVFTKSNGTGGEVTVCVCVTLYVSVILC